MRKREKTALQKKRKRVKEAARGCLERMSAQKKERLRHNKKGVFYRGGCEKEDKQ